MRIKIMVKEKNKVLEIPISKKFVEMMYELAFSHLEDLDFSIKEKLKFYKNILFLQNDVIDKGSSFSFKTLENGTIKFKKLPEPYYLVKKPKWRYYE